MELRELREGQAFKLLSGNDRTYRKINDCGDVLEFNWCRCLDDLKPEQRTGLMLTSKSNDLRIDKHAHVIKIGD